MARRDKEGQDDKSGKRGGTDKLVKRDKLVITGKAGALSAGDQKLVDRLVKKARTIGRRAMVQAVAEVGDLLIEGFFGGDIDLARSSSPVKELALEEFIRRAPDTGFAASTLRRAVPVALQMRVLHAEVADAMSLRQHLSVLAVTGVAEKNRVAAVAVAKDLSGPQIRRLVRGEHGPARTGRPPKPELMKGTEAALRLLTSPEMDDALKSAAVRALDADQRRKLRADATSVRERAERILDALGRIGD